MQERTVVYSNCLFHRKKRSMLEGSLSKTWESMFWDKFQSTISLKFSTVFIFFSKFNLINNRKHCMKAFTLQHISHQHSGIKAKKPRKTTKKKLLTKFKLSFCRTNFTCDLKYYFYNLKKWAIRKFTGKQSNLWEKTLVRRADKTCKMHTCMQPFFKIKHGKFRQLAYMYFDCFRCSSESLFKMSR